MKRILLLASIILFTAAILAGCSPTPPASNANAPDEPSANLNEPSAPAKTPPATETSIAYQTIPVEEWLEQIEWEALDHTVSTKLKDISFSIIYPKGWYLYPVTDQDYSLIIQTLEPNPNINDHPLPDGFVKIEYMVDVKADPNNLLNGEGSQVVINGRTWQQEINSGGIYGDRTLVMETAVDGTVFRVSAFIHSTRDKGNAFNRQVALIEYMINNLQLGQ